MATDEYRSSYLAQFLKGFSFDPYLDGGHLFQNAMAVVFIFTKITVFTDFNLLQGTNHNFVLQIVVGATVNNEKYIYLPN